ncbi:hypothetical protein OESDEN_02726 [Oesophagostomum dentatum]|uniref:Uncharacterized protein n=1 Tax=Oesophagostomum dentatum TaxID=61180 RepID=A0A0B1TPG9_OESDE|nr:hypothetical protein OESDEN_02726 [Oesophagostomum dentatum]
MYREDEQPRWMLAKYWEMISVLAIFLPVFYLGAPGPFLFKPVQGGLLNFDQVSNEQRFAGSEIERVRVMPGSKEQCCCGASCGKSTVCAGLVYNAMVFGVVALKEGYVSMPERSSTDGEEWQNRKRNAEETAEKCSRIHADSAALLLRFF